MHLRLGGGEGGDCMSARKLRYWCVMAPWFAIALPFATLAFLADWYAFTADDWMSKKLAPLRVWFESKARKP